MKIAIAASFVALLAGSAYAADIRVSEFQSTPIVFIDGPIVEGDGAKFISATEKLKSGIVLMHSPGGSLVDGIAIGKQVRRKGLATWVSAAQGPCISACAFAWLGGFPRMMDETSQIGFHAASIVEDGKRNVSSYGNALLGAYLAGLGLNDKTMYFVTYQKPEAVQWLSPQDAKNIGLQISITKKDPPAKSVNSLADVMSQVPLSASPPSKTPRIKIVKARRCMPTRYGRLTAENCNR